MARIYCYNNSSFVDFAEDFASMRRNYLMQENITYTIRVYHRYRFKSYRYSTEATKLRDNRKIKNKNDFYFSINYCVTGFIKYLFWLCLSKNEICNIFFFFVTKNKLLYEILHW